MVGLIQIQHLVIVLGYDKRGLESGVHDRDSYVRERDRDKDLEAKQAPPPIAKEPTKASEARTGTSIPIIVC